VTVKKRCLYTEVGKLPNYLIHERSLSISAYTTTVTIYSCEGDKSHPSHLVRLDFGKRLDTTQVKGFLVPEDSRKRLFPRDKHLRCPIGKCKMSFRKTLTEKLGETTGTVDIYKCNGSARGHYGHITRVSHGILDGLKIPIIIVTIEKEKENY
tara:strand:+ start:23684 stop:24142 length:459 start_codon:yes stop_codon:yes gene_type:complete